MDTIAYIDPAWTRHTVTVTEDIVIFGALAMNILHYHTSNPHALPNNRQ